MDMLDGLDLNLQVHLRRRLLHMAAEFQVAQQVVGLVHQGSTESLPAEDDLQDEDEDDSPPPFATPIVSASSTPRSVTPEPTHQITVTVNNYVTGNLNFVPVAPPNSPRCRGSRKDSKKTRTSGNEADVESVASGSTTSLHDVGSSADELSDNSRSHVPPSPLVRQPLEPIPSSPPPAYTEHAADDSVSDAAEPELDETTELQVCEKVDACTSTSPSLGSIAGLFERPVQPEFTRTAYSKPRSQSDAALFAKTARRRSARSTHNEAVQTDPEEGIFTFPPDERSRESSTDPSFLSGEEDNADEHRTKLDRIQRMPAEGDITEESGVDSDEGVLEDVDASDDGISTSATAASGTVIMLTGDLSDMTLSPTVERVSFKTEVASSSSPVHHESCKFLNCYSSSVLMCDQ